MGCPKEFSITGGMGAALLSKPDTVRDILTTLVKGLPHKPITCKIRLLPRFEDTLRLVETLVGAGCQLLTVHGRTKEMNKQAVRETDWDAIRRIREAVGGRIPVLAMQLVPVDSDDPRMACGKKERPIAPYYDNDPEFPAELFDGGWVGSGWTRHEVGVA